MLDQRDLYHTGSIVGYHAGADAVVVISDVTPAYTNSQSGPGEFSHRTRRVERLWRTLIYDRAADAVIVRDVVTATRANLEKRWLLHTTNKPFVTGNGFTVDLPANPARKQSGGHLDAHVLLPQGARLNAIGGPGFEFWVDGKNYDENGALAGAIARRGQPVEHGNWRMEVMPPTHRIDDEFLVVLVPRSGLSAAAPSIRKIERGREHGVEIVGTAGTRLWWFDPETGSVNLETASGNQTIHANLPNDVADSSLLDRFKNWWRARLN
jgi:hypothetical protein